MSNIDNTATSTLYVNGQPAEQEIAKLKKEIIDYRNQLQKIATDKSLGVNSKQWNDVRQKMLATEKELGKIQSGVANVTQVMRRLDKATPNELRKSLKQLKNDLDNIERGSRAWNEHQRKIKAVKAELAKINAESKVQLSLWGRFAKKMFEWGTAIQTVMATITGVTLTIRQSVNAFAEMDQEMANVRKYTGMTADEVERLNEEFKTMNTRSSREQLNQLAQEAGRLGMQSQEDVMGFVRAADKINVALDELGDGATLTLSKLTDIFGDRERLGVEKSLLAVGSVINELSQNCTASAPYIAEFASRLAGVGANAGMTTQQIMGFAAVMDSYGQKVESSATALSQVIVRLYRDPAKYAKVAGLDVRNFTDLLKKDANAALIQLLETLNKVGGMDVLSPMFADMGENGSRAIQALSTMAKHIDEVKAQQEVANQAFAEAISIDKEFNVQNNTVQAGLEKAKKSFNEMAVTLGEKLAPMMKYTITSSAALMKSLAETVEFVGKHKTALVNTAIALTAFTVAVNASTLAIKLNAAGSKIAAGFTSLWNGILRAGTAIQKTFAAAVGYGHVVVTLFTKGATAARIEFAALNAVIKANPFGILLTVITAVILAIVNLTGKTDEYTKAAKENIKAAKGLSEEYFKEQRELDVLFGKLDAAKKGTKEYESAKKSIVNQYGQYLSGLINEKGEIINLTEAYNRLTFAIRRSAQERGIAAAREKNTQDYFSTLSADLQELQSSLEKVGVPVREAARIVQKVSDAATSGKSLEKPTSDWLRAYSSRDGWNNIFSPGKTPWGIANRIFNRNDEYNRSERAFDAMEQAASPYKNIPLGRLENSLKQLEKIISSGKADHALVIVGGNSPDEFRKVSVDEAKKLVGDLSHEIAYKKGQNGTSSNAPIEVAGGHGGGSYSQSGGGTGSGGGSSVEPDKFAAEKAWKEREEALNKIAWLKGEKDYEEYTSRMLEIEVEYHKKRLEHTNLEGNERVTIQAEYLEAQKKQQDQYNKWTIEEENRAYLDLKRQIQDDYLKNRFSTESYNMQMENIEMAHLRAMTYITKEGTEERAKAEETYRARLISDQQKRQAEFEKKEKEHQQKLEEMWNEYAVSQEDKRKKVIEETEKLLEEMYKSKLALIEMDDSLTPEQRQQAIDKLTEQYKSALKKLHESTSELGHSLEDWIGKLFDKLFGEGTWGKYGETIKSMFASVTSVFSSLNAMADAENELRLARLEKYYEREISMAEGNAYKVKQIERKKQKEEAKLKAEASKRQFAQQVISAIAQTATAALNAYATAPPPTMVWGPIAAAMATAAGLVQIAAIKKQQAASLAQGYARGGFTPPGRPDEAVGVVHAGEWVASQKLLKNPQTRAAIETLDYAQRNNAFGVIRSVDVSRQITAPSVLTQTQPQVIINENQELGEVLARLNERLNEPFVTVNTVTGDLGMKRVQDDYQSLMNNTLPKSKRK